MTLSAIERSPQRYARLGGILYLAIILLGMFGEIFVRGTLVVSGDATASVNSILPAQFLWRAGIAGDLMMHVFDVPVIVILYFLLRPVSQSLALFASCINLVQTAVLATNKLNLLVPLFLMEDSAYLNAFSPEQLHALSYLSIKAHGYGFGIGLIFFGVACLARGYLIFRSGYLPKFLGVLMLAAGFSYLINSFALILAPAFATAIFPGILMPAFIGELFFCLWLIFKGVNLKQWESSLAMSRHADAAAN
ncbi:DUF4386 domain-containing protein [Undibacterium sp. Jales W-56]|uniref:DUF4386 domain-containing protein n=1 Tax=Undibacterium sp. Jales W-56 TaxID=2897325 RepID=UPI0021CDF0AB|nr:DUF4386 domain-containing protein [Undibacterium sp. Jales W-56]MCU6432818.1 DUF4386 domain-containing protein [Undibacterium sp. Jales W-56]